MNGLGVPAVMVMAAVAFAMMVVSARVCAGSSGLVAGRCVSLRESGFGVASLTGAGLSEVVPDTLAAVSFEILSASSLEGIKIFFGTVPENAGGAR